MKLSSVEFKLITAVNESRNIQIYARYTGLLS